MSDRHSHNCSHTHGVFLPNLINKTMSRSAFKSVVLLFVLVVCSVGGLLTRAHAGLTLYGSAFSSDFFDPNQNFSKLYDINPLNGAATLIGNIGYRLVGGMAFDESGTLYGVGETLTNPGDPPPPTGNLVLITINRTTGMGTTVGALGVSKNFQDISFRHSDGQLYAYASGELYTVNKGTGAASIVGATGEAEIGGGIAFSSGDTLLKAGYDHLFTLDQSTGSGSPNTFSGGGTQLSYPTGGTPNATGMDFDSATGVLWAAVHADATSNSPAYLATIDTVTGLVTKIGDSVVGLTALAAIPEPSTYGVLAGLGLVGIGMASSARRRKAPVA